MELTTIKGVLFDDIKKNMDMRFDGFCELLETSLANRGHQLNDSAISRQKSDSAISYHKSAPKYSFVKFDSPACNPDISLRAANALPEADTADLHLKNASNVVDVGSTSIYAVVRAFPI